MKNKSYGIFKCLTGGKPDFAVAEIILEGSDIIAVRNFWKDMPPLFKRSDLVARHADLGHAAWIMDQFQHHKGKPEWLTVSI